MRIVMCSLVLLAIVACSQRADKANDATADAMAANAVAPAAFQLNQTTLEFTSEGKLVTETIDANGNYVVWSGAEHIDHGKMVMKGDRACFDSAMDQEGETCWTTAPTEIGQSWEATNDKGEKLIIKRIDFMAVPEPVQP
jgi:hypothetical protein